MSRGAVVRWVLAVWMLSPPLAEAQSSDRVQQRYEEMLARRPRKGTALRNLYNLHVEALDVEAWLTSLEARMEAHPEQASAALLAGLAFQEHGNLEEAYACFEQAAGRDPEDWVSHHGMGEVAYLQGRYDDAVAHLARAVDHTAVREERVILYRLLGMANLRARRMDEARRWLDRWVNQTPGDPDAVEQVAEMLFDEGETEAASGYYRSLVASPDISPYRRALAGLRLAELEEQAGRPEEAANRYRALLRQLGPDSWLYEEVYARLDGLFRAADNIQGLEDLYRSQVAAHPEDLEVRVRWADLLLEEGRDREAVEGLEAAVASAPLRHDVRARLADAYVQVGRAAESVAEWDRLVAGEPGNIGYRVRLAAAWLERDDIPDHRAAARAVLEGIAALDPESPRLVFRAAEELVEAGLTDAATRQFQRAAALDPEDPAIHEAYGGHLLAQGERAAALAVFRSRAEGPGRTPANLADLTERLLRHGYGQEAAASAREAIALAPDDADVVLRAVKALQQEGLGEEALRAVATLRAGIPAGDDQDRVTEEWIARLAQMGQLEPLYEEVTADLEEDQDGARRDDRLLAARLALKLGWWTEAAAWIDPVALRPDATPRELEVAESVYQVVGDIQRSLDVLERMVALEPRRRPDVLKRIVDLHRKTGSLDKALLAAEELQILLPGSPQGYQLASRLYVQLDNFTRAFQALREAIRVAPDTMSLRVELAGLYQERAMIPEAIETYWQVLRLAPDVPGKLVVVEPLAKLYAGQGRFDALVERLRALERTARDPEPATLALAGAYQAANDVGAARRELTELAGAGAVDPEVLRRLVGLCRQEGELDQAVRHQRRLVDVEPSEENYLALGNLELERRNHDAALAAWREARARRSAARPDGGAMEIEWARQLEANGLPEEARTLVESLHQHHPDDWRITFEMALQAMADDDPAQASLLLRETLRVPDPIAHASDGPATLGLGPGTSSNTGALDPDLAFRFPPENVVLQRVSAAKQEIVNSVDASGRGLGGGDGPKTAAEARDRAVVYLALLDGAHPDHDAWLAAIRTGSRSERRLLVEIAYVLENTEFTRAVCRDLMEAYPDDGLGRFLAMTPSRAHVQFGMEDAFLEDVDRQLSWFREHQPQYAWFYDLHELRVLALHGGRPARARRVAERLIRTGRSDPFVLTQAMSQLRQAGFFDLYEQSVEGALEFYRRRGGAAQRDQLVSTLAQLAQQSVRRTPAEPDTAFRIFSRYLDVSDPLARGQRRSGPGWTGGLASSSRQGAGPAAFPAQSTWWDPARLNQLRRMHQTCQELGLEANLLAMMEARASSVPPERAVGDRLGACYVAHWSGDDSRAREALQGVLEAAPDNDEVLLIGARFYERIGDPGAAYALARGIRSSYGPLHRQGRFYVLRLAVEAGDREAALAAASSLSTLRLTPPELRVLADFLVGLDQPKLAQTLEKRAERLRQSAGGSGGTGTPGGLAGQVAQVLALDGGKDPEGAIPQARQILRRPPTAAVTGEVRHKAQLLDLLKRRGVLSELRREAEEAIRAGRVGLGVWEELFWYRWAEEDYVGAVDAWESIMEGSRDLQASRIWLAAMLFQVKAHAEAILPLAKVLRDDPARLFEQGSDSILLMQAYERAERLDELSEAIRAVETKDLMIGHRRFGSQRSPTVSALLQFASVLLTRQGFPRELSLHVAELAGGLLTSRTLRRQHGAQVADQVTQALLALGRDEALLRTALSCVTEETVLSALGIEPVPYAVRQPMQGQATERTGVNTLVLRAVEAAHRLGRVEELAAAAESGSSDADGPVDAYLAWLCAIRLKDPARTARWQDRALTQTLPAEAARNPEWTRALQYLTGARLLSLVGWNQQAISVLEQSFRDDSIDAFSSLKTVGFRQYLDVCRATDNRERARTLVLERIASLWDSDLGTLGPGVQMHGLFQAMEWLLELECYADALALGQRIRGLPNHPQTAGYRRRVDQLLVKLEREHLPELVAGGALEPLIAEARRAMDAHPDEPVYWENLHRLLMAADDPEAAALRRRVRTQAGDRAAWRLGLGRAAQAAGDPEAAAGDYLLAFRGDPATILQDRALAQDLLACVLDAGRRDDFLAVLGELDWQPLLPEGGNGRSRGPSQRINTLFGLAEAAGKGATPDFVLSFRLAQRVRAPLQHRQNLIGLGDRFAELMWWALPNLGFSPEAQFQELLALTASPVVVQTLAPAASGLAGRPTWLLGSAWGPDGVSGGLIALLDAAESGGRIPALRETCRAAWRDGDAGQAYWVCLVAARAGDLAEVESTLAEATTAAMSYLGDPGMRAYLLSVLAQEIQASDGFRMAQACYEKAMQLVRQYQGNPDAVAVASYLAALLVDQGARDQAHEVLLAPWVSDPTAHQLVRRQNVEMRRAGALLQFEFYADAWLTAYEVYNQLTGQIRNRIRGEAKLFLDRFMDQHLDDVRDAGELLGLIADVENRWGTGRGTPELWSYLYRMYEKVGDREGQQRSRRRQEQAFVGDPAGALALADTYRSEGDPVSASRLILDVFRSDPFLVLRGRDTLEARTEAILTAGKRNELTRTLAAVAEQGQLESGPGGRNWQAIGHGLLIVARTAARAGANDAPANDLDPALLEPFLRHVEYPGALAVIGQRWAPDLVEAYRRRDLPRAAWELSAQMVLGSALPPSLGLGRVLFPDRVFWTDLALRPDGAPTGPLAEFLELGRQVDALGELAAACSIDARTPPDPHRGLVNLVIQASAPGNTLPADWADNAVAWSREVVESPPIRWALLCRLEHMARDRPATERRTLLREAEDLVESAAVWRSIPHAPWLVAKARWTLGDKNQAVTLASYRATLSRYGINPDDPVRLARSSVNRIGLSRARRSDVELALRLLHFRGMGRIGDAAGLAQSGLAKRRFIETDLPMWFARAPADYDFVKRLNEIQSMGQDPDPIAMEALMWMQRAAGDQDAGAVTEDRLVSSFPDPVMLLDLAGWAYRRREYGRSFRYARDLLQHWPARTLCGEEQTDFLWSSYVTVDRPNQLLEDVERWVVPVLRDALRRGESAAPWVNASSRMAASVLSSPDLNRNLVRLWSAEWARVDIADPSLSGPGYGDSGGEADPTESSAGVKGNDPTPDPTLERALNTVGR